MKIPTKLLISVRKYMHCVNIYWLLCETTTTEDVQLSFGNKKKTSVVQTQSDETRTCKDIKFGIPQHNLFIEFLAAK